MAKLSFLALILAAIASGQDALPAPPTATVYVYRIGGRVSIGVAGHPWFYCDGRKLAQIHAGTFTVAHITPGDHMISAELVKVGQFLDLEAGKRYFFRLAFRNFKSDIVTLQQVPETQAVPEMQKLKLQN